MDIAPIFSTLRRHKTAAALIVLEVALSCAILCNAVHLIAGRIERMQQPSGVAETELLRIQLASLGKQNNADVQTREDLSLLRQLAGVKAATVTNQVPFGNSGWQSGISLKPDQEEPTLTASMYTGGESFLATTGLRLVAGRDFTADEYRSGSEVLDAPGEPAVPVAIITRAMAERLFPAGGALGKSIYPWNRPTQVIGIVEELAPISTRGDPYALILPLRTAYSDNGSYLLRVEPGQRAAVLKSAVAALEQANRQRILLKHESFEEIRDAFFQQDRAMAWLLVAMCLALLVVTALGIVGLASFWVQQRTRMIGTRRALGATRGQILRYFQTENLLLTSMGIALGMAGAYAINQLLMIHYELPRLPPPYLPLGALVLWALGQIAVLGPAMRAAALPPVVVMRGA
ncbi:MAG TPA: FtsX-like permease family protein [Ideonella sp.]|nr:FtsX-like permease family protein [Ideonella sp.]